MVDELSIIISALNEEQYLPQLLTSIAKQTFDGKLEVLVIDGHSDDHTVQVAKSFQNRIPSLKLYYAKRNLSIARNIGAANARFATLLFLDADVVLPDHFLSTLQKRFHPKKKKFAVSVVHWCLE